MIRPDGLSDPQWEAVEEARARLERAREASDSALVVGSAKELCEVVAKIVLSERGELPGSSEDFPALVNRCHKLLGAQPGQELATDDATRQIAQGLKSLVLGLGNLRNNLGTGHGRAVPSAAITEHADLSFAAADIWCHWALRRLGPLIVGTVSAIVRDLDEGKIFRSGDLAGRLEAADLQNQSQEDQRRLGIAVARRALRGTFVVHSDGFALEGKTTAYQEGLVVGLLFDADGRLLLPESEWLSEGGRILDTLPPEVRTGLLTQMRESVPSYLAATTQDDAAATIARIRSTIPSAGTIRKFWEEFLETLEQTASSG